MKSCPSSPLSFALIGLAWACSLACGQDSGSLVMWGQSSLPDPAEVHDIIAVAAADRASLALRADGRILSWGQGPIVVVPSPNDGFTDVWAASGSAVALREDGSLCGWGQSWASQIPQPNTGFVKAAMNKYHCLGLKSDGTIVAWGSNSYNQCVVPEPNMGWIDIAAGWSYSMGLKSDGSIKVWGSIDEEDLEMPTPNTGFVGIETGGYVNQYVNYLLLLGIRNDGILVDLGYGDHPLIDLPITDSPFVHVSLSNNIGIAIRDDGTSAAFNIGGSFVSLDSTDISIAGEVGNSHGIRVRENGQPVFWGSNVYGQQGLAQDNIGFNDVEFYSEGEYSALVVQRQDSTLYSQGHWQLFNIPGNVKVNSFALGALNGIGVTSQGHVLEWGWGAYPSIEPIETAVAVATGGILEIEYHHDVEVIETKVHNLALLDNGSIVAWGNNEYGQCHVPVPNGNFVAVDAASTYSVALDDHGIVHCWGTLPDLYNNGNIVAIDAGPDYCLALRGDGSVVAWGSNTQGQCQVPEPNEGFVAISAGEGAALALRADGSIVCWGHDAIEPPAPNAGFLDAKLWDKCGFAIRRSEVAVAPPEIVARPGALDIVSTFPNPFNPVVQVEFETREAALLELAVFNLAGQRVWRRDLGWQAPGRHKVSWDGRGPDGRNLASGTYFLRVADAQGRGAVAPCLLQR